MDALCEMGAGQTMMDYLQAIPALTAHDKREFLNMPDEDGWATLIAR